MPPVTAVVGQRRPWRRLACGVENPLHGRQALHLGYWLKVREVSEFMDLVLQYTTIV